MPKLGPPPRSAQNRSGCSSALATTSSPAAVMRRAESSESAARPSLRSSQPEPDPSREPGDADRGDARAGHGEAVRLRGRVDHAPGCAALHAQAAGRRVDLDAVHPGEIDRQRVVSDRETSWRVAAAAHGHGHAALARMPQRGGDVARPFAARDQRRAAIDGRVVHLAGLAVGGISGAEDLAGEVADGGRVQGGGQGARSLRGGQIIDGRAGPAIPARIRRSDTRAEQHPLPWAASFVRP